MIRHFTVTTYIIQEKKTLLLYHPKLRKWLPPGGHLEANELPTEGAKREVEEETGLHIEFIRQENLWVECWNASSLVRPILCLLEEIPPHGDVPAHQHMDLIYLAYPTGGSIRQDLIDKQELAWHSLDEVLEKKTDVEIFGETKQVIRWILSQDFEEAKTKSY